MTDLHEFIRICSGMTANEMWSYLERSRRCKIMWAGVPESREGFEAGLTQLERDGLAVKGPDYVWHWIPARRQPVAEPKGDRLLFS